MRASLQRSHVLLSSDHATEAGLGAAGPALVIPLFRRAGLWGIAVAIGTAVTDPDNEEWASIVLAHINIALEAAESRQIRDRLEAFLGQAETTLPRLVSSSESPGAFLSSFAGWLNQWLGADEYQVWSLDAGKLQEVSSRQGTEKSMLGRRTARALVERALRTGTHIEWIENGDGPAGSALIVPVKDQDSSIGILSFFWNRMLAYGHLERDALLTLVARTETALEELRLQQEGERNLTQLAQLSASAASMVSSPDTTALIRAITHATAIALQAPIVGVATLDDKGQLILSPHGHIGVTNEFVREFPSLTAPDGVCHRVLSSAGATMVDPSSRVAVLLHARAVICAPLMTGQDALGVLFVGYPDERVFGPAELSLLSAYASQSALALNNLSLRDSLTKHLDRLGTFSEFGRTLASSLDLEQTIRSILDSAHDVLETDGACIFLKDKDQGTLTLRACRGTLKSGASWSQLGDDWQGFGLPELAIEQDRILISKDLARDGRNKYREIARQKGPISAMVSPLKSKGRPLGAIYVSINKIRDFTEYDRRLLSMLADSAGIALENARLYEQEKERAAFLASLVREANHRIRNSLQTIAGLLEVELTAPQRPPAEALRKSITRIYCIAAVHGALSQREIQQVEMKDSIQRIGEIARRSAGRSADDIVLQVTGARLVLPSQKATSLSLAVNELLDNALQHGLAPLPTGKVTVSISQSDRTAVVTISDNGVGLPEGFQLARDARVGLKIAAGVAGQDLGGQLTVSANGTGTRAQIRFPLTVDASQASALEPA